MQNVLNSQEWREIWLHKTFEIEIQMGWASNSDILQKWFPQEIRSSHFNF